MMSAKNKLSAKLTRKFLRKWWVVIGISLVLLICSGLVALFFTSLVDLVIDGQVVLKEKSQTFGWWKKPPVHPIMRVYIYNVTNADEFLNNGEKPKLEELGPYVYIETWEKVDVKFNDNDTVSFNQQKIFKFSPELSIGDEDDMVVVPNIPMLSATSQSKHAARFLRLAMASIMDILKIKPFVEVTVGQLLWGYEDPLLKLAKDVVPKEQKLPYEEFGLMYGLKLLARLKKLRTVHELLGELGLGLGIDDDIASVAILGLGMLLGPRPGQRRRVVGRVPLADPYNHERDNLNHFSLMRRKNGTSPDRVTIFTGAGDITRYGLIDKFNGRSHLPHWTRESCNRLNGSDGSIFPPHITPNTTLYVYDKDMCRLLPLKFQKEVETDGNVPGYRFSPADNVFGDKEHNPENDCFCPHGPPCAPNGLFNVSLCQYDSPVLLSFPHFYMGDQSLRLAVEGISPPEMEKHGFFLDVQPQMGTALRATARVQINLAVSQVVDIKQVATFPDIVFPIMWFEDGIQGLPEEVTHLLHLATSLPPVAKSALTYGLVALGGIMLVLAVTCLVRSSGRQETLNLEGTSHYVKPEKKKPTNGHAHNGHSGKTLETLNPAFLNDNGTGR